jgi:hypothetical protein
VEAAGTRMEGYLKELEKAWGVSSARDIVIEALERCAAHPNGAPEWVPSERYERPRQTEEAPF